MNGETKSWLNDRYFELLEPQAQFQTLFKSGLKTWPIPFFGDLSEAEVLTVGVNPSCHEFAGGRWAHVTTPLEAQMQLLRYFEKKGGQHPWFDTWEAALNKIGASYYPGNGRQYSAAHIDLSSRATLPMSNLPVEPFLGMVRYDLPRFIDFLEQASHAKLLVLAGSVTGHYYLNEVLGSFLPEEFARVQGAFNPRAQPGPAKTVFQWLEVKRRKLPLFFCSSGPSDREHRHLLIQRMHELSASIKRHGKL